MENQHNIDRRVVKTKRAIKSAFAELLSTKSIDQITVTDIANTADINRKTFYRYYADVDALVEEIENEIIDRYVVGINATDFSQWPEETDLLFSHLDTVVKDEIDFFGHLISSEENYAFLLKASEALKTKIKESLLAKFPAYEEKIDLVLDFSIAGVAAVYREWFNSQQNKNLEEVAEEINVLLFSGICGLLPTSESAAAQA